MHTADTYTHLLAGIIYTLERRWVEQSAADKHQDIFHPFVRGRFLRIMTVQTELRVDLVLPWHLIFGLFNFLVQDRVSIYFA